ncbi:hypothetical protein [Priestia taiwanensis]|uniref:Uncharacterized protein n=1 Tax=Priestia taiwanensis TaxID=1347902 RepID=A0A917AX18_9BACI|nr:hypothetical protein [Priestia taiwanensis]MBM7364664.1 hypothetical protein [Priestia taiwanensis]GGE78643.1 hypothetical protein GCM10007140_30290 [Priestia taiwanensis]
MSMLISEIEWIEKSSVVDELRQREEHIIIHPMIQGLEAEVIKMCIEEDSFVLKVWNKHSKPDVCFQYQLLKSLVERGIAVSKPFKLWSRWWMDAS